jgi:cytochrome c553
MSHNKIPNRGSLMRRTCFAVIAASLFTTSLTAALVEGNPQAGEAKTTPCQSCHGPDGNSPSAEWPKLAGQHARYLKKQLQDYKSGARANPIMSSIAADLSNEDIRHLAVYYANRPIDKGVTPEQYLEMGQTLYRQGNKETGIPACAACHGPAGDGNPAAAWPRIGGQHAKYVEDQLKAYREGNRANDPNGMMRDVAKKMTDEEITAIAHYVAGLYPAY